MALPLALIGMIPSIINLFTGETSRTDSVIDLAKKAGEALGMENASPEDVLKHIEQNPDAVVNPVTKLWAINATVLYVAGVVEGGTGSLTLSAGSSMTVISDGTTWFKYN